MLTAQEREDERYELQENWRRLGADEQRALQDMQMSHDELAGVLEMDGENPSLVWELRDYLDDKMHEEGIEMVPWCPKLAHHSRNKWFPYATPWRDPDRRAPSLHWEDD